MQLTFILKIVNYNSLKTMKTFLNWNRHINEIYNNLLTEILEKMKHKELKSACSSSSSYKKAKGPEIADLLFKKMVKLISIIDFWKQKMNYVIMHDKNEGYSYVCTKVTQSYNDVLREYGIKEKHKTRMIISGIDYYYLNKELSNFNEYKRILYLKLDKRKLNVLQLRMQMPEKQIIDWTWNRLLIYILWERIQIDYTMAWLSTLGGGFSALGEQYYKCAQVAGKISMKQLHIGMRLGDPFLQARCKLYYSISLIQMGRLRSAKYLIKQQYKFAYSNKAVDDRLVKMCHGIWHRLQYEYGLRLKQRQCQLKSLRYEGACDK